MSDNTPLGDRMKRYEAVTKDFLPRRTYTIIRVDGKAFHSYLRGAGKPFDERFMADMDNVTAIMCKEVSGTVFAYTQSDEISLLLQDFASVHTEPWLGGNVQKMASISASLATMALNSLRTGFPLFDARVFTIPDPVEVANYFIWRQRDAVRNSISMAAQAHFSHGRLHGKDGNAMQELLWCEEGVNWNDYPDRAKRGGICVKEAGMEEVTFLNRKTMEEETVTPIRTRWVPQDAPHFSTRMGSFLSYIIPEVQSFTAGR